MLSSLALRKLKDKLGSLRPLAIFSIKAGLVARKAFFRVVCFFPVLRLRLRLPSGRWIPVAECAQINPGDSCRFLDQPLNVTRKIPQTNAPENEWWYEQNRQTSVDGTLVVSLKNGRALGHCGGQFLNSRDDMVNDISTEHWLYFGNFFVDTRVWLPEPKTYSGRVAVLADRFARDNFSHWVFDVLPKIGLLERTVGLATIDHFLVGHSDRPYQWDTLERLGVPRAKVISFTPSSCVRAEELIVPICARFNSQSHQASSLRFLRENFLLQPCANPNRRLFLSRSDASFRNLLQEKEICQHLGRKGFEVVTLAGVSLEKTAELFASAEVVVGPFGSGLMNVCFCPPGALLIDIATPEFYNAHHWYLAEESGMEYACYFGSNRAFRRNRALSSATADISVNVPDCLAFIDARITAWESSRQARL